MDEEKPEFKIGGFCRLTAEAAAKVDSTPARLLKAGWPNEFLIVEIYEDEEKEKGKLLRLDPCCGWMKDLRDDEKNACEAHPAKFFEPLPGHISEDIENESEAQEDEAVGPAGGRYTGVGVGDNEEDLVGVEYVNGEKSKTFFLRRAGQAPIVISGTGAQRLGKILTKLGIL